MDAQEDGAVPCHHHRALGRGGERRAASAYTHVLQTCMWWQCAGDRPLQRALRFPAIAPSLLAGRRRPPCHPRCCCAPARADRPVGGRRGGARSCRRHRPPPPPAPPRHLRLCCHRRGRDLPVPGRGAADLHCCCCCCWLGRSELECALPPPPPAAPRKLLPLSLRHTLLLSCRLLLCCMHMRIRHLAVYVLSAAACTCAAAAAGGLSGRLACACPVLPMPSNG